MFRFKQFTILDDRCAHRVGTDGVLLGAWADVCGARRILDIGTGSGLVALMAAQRNPVASVVGVEVDAASARQARENVLRSPFRERVVVEEDDVREFRTEECFDCILCNPPFFTEDTLSPNAQRARARHAEGLRFADLLAAACRLLSPGGQFHVILPSNAETEFVNQAFISGLRMVRRCQVRTVQRKAPKRVMIAFSREGTITLGGEELLLQNADGSRSTEYSDLTKDFYL